MAKERKPYKPTTKAMVRSALRRHLWLRSRERGECQSREKNTCQRCGVKGSKAKGREVKTVVHHTSNDTQMEKAIDILLEHLLCHPDLLELLCDPCHKLHHSLSAEEQRLAQAARDLELKRGGK